MLGCRAGKVVGLEEQGQGKLRDDGALRAEKIKFRKPKNSTLFFGFGDWMFGLLSTPIGDRGMREGYTKDLLLSPTGGACP